MFSRESASKMFSAELRKVLVMTFLDLSGTFIFKAVLRALVYHLNQQTNKAELSLYMNLATRQDKH